MLKLIKYDIQKCWKKYLTLFLIFVSCLTMSCLLSASSTIIAVIQGSSLIISYLAILTIYVDFFKNNFGTLFGKNSSLLQTLPLTHHEILLSKVIEGIILIVLSLSVLTGYVFFTYYHFGLTPGYARSFYVLIEYWGQPLSTFINFSQLLDILLKIVVLTMLLLTIYAVYTLQHSGYSRSIKICAGTIITAVCLMLFVIINPHPLSQYSLTSINYVGNVAISLVLYTIICIILYIFTKYLLDYKLEL